MTTLRNLAALLAFRTAALRWFAARRAVLVACMYLLAGFAVYVLIRNSVYAELREPLFNPGWFGTLLNSNLVQLMLFGTGVYVPAVICLSNAIAGDGLGLTFSREEYQAQLSSFGVLWGILFLLCAPLQLVFPQFLVLGVVAISLGRLVLSASLIVYTVWAVRELNHISTVAAIAVFALSTLTFPVFYLLSSFFFALPLFIMFPLAYLGFVRLRSLAAAREQERALQRHLQSLTANQRDADARYQLGLIHMKRGNLPQAQTSFEDALKTDPEDPDYHYWLGRLFETKGDWAGALEQYEETYRRSPEYGQGDIFREVGKAYLHVGKLEKAVEFLQFFLETRGSDPEGRYWLAVAYQRLGKTDEMRVQLNTILTQARSHPRYFRKEKREWIFRSRSLLRS